MTSTPPDEPDEDELLRCAVSEAPAAMRSVYRLEVRLEEERQETLRQIQRLEQSLIHALPATKTKDSELEALSRRVTALEASDASELAGRMDALSSVLANHGARLLEGEANMQVLLERPPAQAEILRKDGTDAGDAETPRAEVEPDFFEGFRSRLKEMEQHQAVVDEQLRQNRSDYNATLGDMKALWREIAALQTQTASAKDLEARFTSQHEDALSQLTEELKQLRQDVAGKFRSAEENADALRSEVASRFASLPDYQAELQPVKRQLQLVESLLLAYREALSEMTVRLRGSLEKDSSAQQPSSPRSGRWAAKQSLAASARRHASVDRMWHPGTQGLKKLVEGALQSVEELHCRVRRVEDSSSAGELADLKRQFDILQGETLLSFHQLQLAVADLNCSSVTKPPSEDGSAKDCRAELESAPTGFTDPRCTELAESLSAVTAKLEGLEADTLSALMAKLEHLEAEAFPDLASRVEQLQVALQQQPERAPSTAAEAEGLSVLTAKLERLEADALPDRVKRLEQVQALHQQLEEGPPLVLQEKAAPVDMQALSALSAKLDRLETQVEVLPDLLGKVEMQEKVRQPPNEATVLQVEALSGLTAKVERLETQVQQQPEGATALQVERLSVLAAKLEQLEVENQTALTAKMDRQEELAEASAAAAAQADLMSALAKRVAILEDFSEKPVVELGIQAEVADLRKNFEALDDQTHELTVSYSQLREMIGDNPEDSTASMSKELQSLRSAIDALSAESEIESTFKDTVERIDGDVARLFARLEDAESSLVQGDTDDQVARTVSDIAALQEAMQSLSLRTTEIEGTLEKLETRSLANETERLAGLNQNVTAMQEELSTLRPELLKDLGRVGEDVTALQSAFDEVSAEVSALRTVQTIPETPSLEEGFTELQQTQAVTTEKLAELQQQLSELQGRFAAETAEAEGRPAADQTGEDEGRELLQRMPAALQSLQESMCGIREELLQVQQRLSGGGVHQPFCEDAGDANRGHQAEAENRGSDFQAIERLSLPRIHEADSELPSGSRTPKVVEVARLAEELGKAHSATLQQTQLEVHLKEAIIKLETQLSGVTLRLDDTESRLCEAELSLDAVSRGGVALRLRLEQLQSSVELRLTSLTADLSDDPPRKGSEQGFSLTKGPALASRRDRERAEATVQELWGKVRRS